MKVKIGVSNRHVHLTDEALEILFGKGYKLEVLHFLSQPNEFASTSKVTIEGSKGKIENVRVVGPTRKYNQVEVSSTDSFKLGVNPPVRNSGDLKESAPIIIVGPCGKLSLDEGCIIANRHIHISNDDLEKYNLKDGQIVSIKINSSKPAILGNVYIKTLKEAKLELHLDTDDANANLVKQGDEALVIYE